MSKLKIYAAPDEAVKRRDFTVKVRRKGKEWIELDVYEVKVDMHDVRKASMSQFDFEGTIEVEIECHNEIEIDKVDIRPYSNEQSYTQQGNTINMTLTKPCKLSIEINNDRFHNLHLFTNALEKNPPNSDDENVLVLKPGIHRAMDITRLLTKKESGKEYDTVYFSPGYHYIEETILKIPSGKHVYLAGGSVVVGAMLCDAVENVAITGRGIIYLSKFERFTAFRGIRIVFSHDIYVEGIVVLDPPHYSIFIGNSNDIHIDNFKSFSTRGWSDGIDMMSSSDITIKDVFMRNSDDCIAIYGSRWDFYGDTTNIKVEDATLWADVAHPINIGTHGDYENRGDTIKNIMFKNINILEHHEPQENYWGAISLNAGDMNIIQDVVFEDIFVEDFELGQLFDIRVVFNKDYNPMPGDSIKKILFKNVIYNGVNKKSSRIYGYDEDRLVSNIFFENLQINGKILKNAKDANIVFNEFVQNVSFK